MIHFSKIFNPFYKIRRDGTAFIYIAAYKNPDVRHFNTGIKIEPHYWSNRLNRVVDHRQTHRYNQIIEDLQAKLEDYAFDFERKYQTSCELENLKYALEEKPTEQISFTDFIEECLERDYKAKKIKKATYRSNKTTLGKLRAFREIILFNMLDYQFLRDFDDWLHRPEHELSQNSISKQHSIFRAMINRAMKYDHIEKNPYLKFTIRYQKTKRANLTLNELVQLQNIDLEPHYTQIRDMFLFSCYTAMRFGDMCRLKTSNFIHRKRKTYLTYTAQKTGKYIELPLDSLFDGRPLAIYKRYKSNNPNALLFGNPTNQHANRRIKQIAKKIGIRTDLTMHSARHTFATIMASHIPTPMLQKIMQHSDIRTTMIYVEMNNQVLDETISSVDVFKGKGSKDKGRPKQ